MIAEVCSTRSSDRHLTLACIALCYSCTLRTRVPGDAQIGRGVVRRGGKDVALVAYGTMANNALAAADMLAKSGVTATVADMR